jgi:hypothetical protein
MELNRILLPDSGFFIPEGNASSRLYKEYSAFQYIIEEFIALGALEIVIEASRIDDTERLNRLPESIKRRVKIVDTEFNCIKKIHAILSPIADELKISFHGYRLRVQGLDRKLLHPIGTLYTCLCSYVPALYYKTSVDIDLNSTLRAIEILKKALKSPDARATLAILISIFNSYKQVNYDSLSLKSTAPSDLSRIFQDFIDDESYQMYSKSAHLFGIPSKLKHSLKMAGRLARQIIKKPLFKPIAGITSKFITVSTQSPAPDPDHLSGMITADYLPPVISLHSVMDNARKAWGQDQTNTSVPMGHDFVNVSKGYWMSSPDGNPTFGTSEESRKSAAKDEIKMIIAMSKYEIIWIRDSMDGNLELAVSTHLGAVDTETRKTVNEISEKYGFRLTIHEI